MLKSIYLTFPLTFDFLYIRAPLFIYPKKKKKLKYLTLSILQKKQF